MNSFLSHAHSLQLVEAMIDAALYGPDWKTLQECLQEKGWSSQETLSEEEADRVCDMFQHITMTIEDKDHKGTLNYLHALWAALAPSHQHAADSYTLWKRYEEFVCPYGFPIWERQWCWTEGYHPF